MTSKLGSMVGSDLQTSLLVHEQRMNGRGGNGQALNETYKDRIHGRGGDQFMKFFEEEIDNRSIKKT